MWEDKYNSSEILLAINEKDVGKINAGARAAY